jgi:hypothetical protein
MAWNFATCLWPLFPFLGQLRVYLVPDTTFSLAAPHRGDRGDLEGRFRPLNVLGLGEEEVRTRDLAKELLPILKPSSTFQRIRAVNNDIRYRKRRNVELFS